VSKIKSLAPDTIANSLKKELKTLELAGAATGFITGVLQVIFTLLIN
jgi:hypothetical protein